MGNEVPAVPLPMILEVIGRQGTAGREDQEGAT
jgi:hypothetical protein